MLVAGAEVLGIHTAASVDRHRAAAAEGNGVGSSVERPDGAPRVWLTPAQMRRLRQAVTAGVRSIPLAPGSKFKMPLTCAGGRDLLKPGARLAVALLAGLSNKSCPATSALSSPIGRRDLD